MLEALADPCDSYVTNIEFSGGKHEPFTTLGAHYTEPTTALVDLQPLSH